MKIQKRTANNVATEKPENSEISRPTPSMMTRYSPNKYGRNPLKADNAPSQLLPKYNAWGYTTNAMSDTTGPSSNTAARIVKPSLTTRTTPYTKTGRRMTII